MKLKDKVAIVVGGAGGIGKATASLLAREGAKAMIADLDIDAAGKVAAEINATGHEAVAVKVDMTKESEAIEMARVTLERFGQIDILANVAGGSIGRFIRDKLGPFAESTKEEWDRIIDVNLNGARHCTRAVINHMMERRTGKIVCFSSIAAIRGMKNGVDYAAAKAGIIGFTKALALEMAQYGIQVNCITPSGVYTERIRKFTEERQEKDPKVVVDTSKFATPEELANIVLFLVSNDISHIVGENIVVGGSQN